MYAMFTSYSLYYKLTVPVCAMCAILLLINSMCSLQIKCPISVIYNGNLEYLVRVLVCSADTPVAHPVVASEAPHCKNRQNLTEPNTPVEPLLILEVLDLNTTSQLAH